MEESVFLLGAGPGIAEEAAKKLQTMFPALIVAGIRDGFFDPEDTPLIVKTINESGAGVLFVALGSPKQEAWIDDNKANLSVSICQGVGGTFDVLAGRVPRAPSSWQRLHLEWLYRMFREPRRIIRHTGLLNFVGLALKELIVRKNRNRDSLK